MIPRTAEPYLKGLAQRFQTVTVIGPRQSGKTTLVKHCFPDKRYVNLENPQNRQFAREDPIGFLQQFAAEGAIFDEIQRVPDLLSYLQEQIDHRQDRGLYIFTGSHQFQLLEQITQSLAGRTFLFRLLPLGIDELAKKNLIPNLNQLLFQGLYPRIYSPDAVPSEIHQAYFDTYIQKDVRQITNIKDLSLFQKFMALCAGRVGQLLNKESLSSDIGINVKTVEDWLSVLEASFVLMRLPPYWTNTRKRLIKTPKLYFCDTGLVSWLLQIRSNTDLASHPLRGQIFENFVVIEALKAQFHRGRSAEIYFYRDSRKREIDLIFDYGQKVFPIEIKSAATYLQEFAHSLQEIADDKRLGKGVIYGGDTAQTRSGVEVVPWSQMPDFFAKIHQSSQSTSLLGEQ